MRDRGFLALGLMFVLAMALLLTGCGKKGAPDPPGPHDKITYPKSYPTR